MLSTEQSSPTTSDTGTKKQSACSRKGTQALFYMGLKARRRRRIQYPHHKPHDLDHQEYKEYRSRCCGDRFPCLRLKDLLHCDKEKADRCTHGKPIIPLVFPPFRVPYTSFCRRFLLRLSLRRSCTARGSRSPLCPVENVHIRPDPFRNNRNPSPPCSYPAPPFLFVLSL